jgi:hypothetical protein
VILTVPHVSCRICQNRADIPHFNVEPLASCAFAGYKAIQPFFLTRYSFSPCPPSFTFIFSGISDRWRIERGVSAHKEHPKFPKNRQRVWRFFFAPRLSTVLYPLVAHDRTTRTE